MRRVGEGPIGYAATPAVLCDVNVLVAHTRPDHPHHQIVCRHLADLAGSNVRFAVSPLILAAVIRIISNRKIFTAATPPAEAVALVERFATYANAVSISTGTLHWRLFRDLVMNTGISGGDVTDAWHAALAIEHNCEFWTLDAGFARFPGLRWRNLLA